ncbi:DUF1554 domain-containing protein [Leptospira congkakensis]|uniref:DUF1554 domain-containing protein n=1 Tax=Leptospira congkakensis TaxID=2484932 RepID=A0A4Z1AEE8_9LEPT|nr:DUF1554 domain-containing protein [Leptospira congkakensis]TGL88763.1 DUF1554 domain-containing protein [Leptospira congkakensis]TGL89349.1 DUF1554 domain-containing protein [Leptospira congkakensis]TGL97317.1 DUF1554 domain-containing protein [Leptospira congkakensis]
MSPKKNLCHYLIFKILILTIFAFEFHCKIAESNNFCDPNSKAFRNTQISKILIKDKSPTCGNDYISTIIPYSISGSITGLASSGLKLSLNGNNSQTIEINSNRFSFTNILTTGSSYAVMITNQPIGLFCTITNGVGLVKDSDITSINITCAMSCNPCKIFLSNSGYPPNPGSAANFDAYCSTDSNYPGTGTYKAMVVDGVTRRASVSANVGDGQIDWIFAPNRTYYQTAGTIGTTSSGGLFISTLTNTFSVNSKYWTGLNSNWTTNASNTCNLWTSNLGTYNGVMGQGNSTAIADITAGWTPDPCNFSNQQLICVEQ